MAVDDPHAEFQQNANAEKRIPAQRGRWEHGAGAGANDEQLTTATKFLSIVRATLG